MAENAMPYREEQKQRGAAPIQGYAAGAYAQSAYVPAPGASKASEKERSAEAGVPQAHATCALNASIAGAYDMKLLYQQIYTDANFSLPEQNNHNEIIVMHPEPPLQTAGEGEDEQGSALEADGFVDAQEERHGLEEVDGILYGVQRQFAISPVTGEIMSSAQIQAPPETRPIEEQAPLTPVGKAQKEGYILIEPMRHMPSKRTLRNLFGSLQISPA